MLAERLNEIGGMRLLRAREYAETGRIRWQVSPGLIRARVEGQATYAVQLEIAPVAVSALAAVLRERPVWAGALLSGRLPEGLSSSVVPRRLSEIEPRCGCPDGVAWCKHAMATLIAVDGAGVGALLSWRGVGQQALLLAMYPPEPVGEEGFWEGGPLPRPAAGSVPTVQEMPPLDIHGTPAQALLAGSVARIQRLAQRMLGR